jgi:hypothetical protein
MVDEIYAVTAAVLGFAMCGVVLYFLIIGHGDRDRDEEAREFFDSHGHWPGEKPS